MIHVKPLTHLLLGVFTSILIVEAVSAQPPGGGSDDFGSRLLRRLDRDENGVLDPEELDRFGPLRDYLSRQNIDVSRPIPVGVVADYQAGMMQEMQAQRGGNGDSPGGFGRGGRGGFGGRGSSPEGMSRGGPPEGFFDGEGRGRGDRSEGRGERGGRGDRFRGGGGDNSRPEGSSNPGSESERRGPRFGRRVDSASPGNGAAPGSSPPGKPGAKAKVRVGRVGPKAALAPATLPAQYAARDINQDGQIGLYEWSRTDLATFNRLDVNHDGFLIPSELASPTPTGSPAGTPSGANTSVATNPAATPATSTIAATGGSPGTAPPSVTAMTVPAASAGPAKDLKTVAAESAFDFLDQEKDGKLSEEEWQRSRNARKMFSDAKVEVQMPLSKEKFVEHYIKLSK